MHANAERGGAIRLVDADFVDAGAAVFMLTGDGLQRMELGMGEGGMRELGKTPVKKSLPLRDFKPWAAALSPAPGAAPSPRTAKAAPMGVGGRPPGGGRCRSGGVAARPGT